jgi:hypothetical protein
VEPTLHQKYTIEEALAAFEPAGSALRSTIRRDE